MHELYSLTDLLLSWVKPLGYLWFLYVLMILFLIVPVLWHVFKRKECLLLLFGGMTLALHSGFLQMPPLLGIWERVWYEGMYFILGAYVYHRRMAFSLKNKRLFYAALAVCVGNCLLYLAGFPSRFLPRTMLVALAGSYLLYYAVVSVQKLSENRFLAILGENCLQLYILHLYFMGPLRTVLAKLGNDSVWLGVAVGTLLGTIGPLCIAHIAKKNSILNFVFEPVKSMKKMGIIRP